MKNEMFHESLAEDIVPPTGAEVVEMADQIVDQTGYTAPLAVLQELLERLGRAAALAARDSGGRLSAATIFDSFAYPGRSDLRRQLEKNFAVVALPGTALNGALREGDLLLRRGDGQFAHVAVIASPQLRSLDALLSAGLKPENFTAGNYAHVVEAGAVPHTSHQNFARLVTGPEGLLPADSLVLRLGATPPGEATDPAASDFSERGSRLLEDILAIRLATPAPGPVVVMQPTTPASKEPPAGQDLEAFTEDDLTSTLPTLIGPRCVLPAGPSDVDGGSPTTTIFGWQQYDDNVAFLPQPEQDKVDRLADLIVTSFAQSVSPPFRLVQVVAHADKDWHGTDYEDAVSRNRAKAMCEALTTKVRKLWTDRNMGPPPPGGIATELHWMGSRKLIAPDYHAANRRVEVFLVATGAPIPRPTPKANLRERIERALILLDVTGLVPDATGKRTARTRCILEKLKPAVGTPDTRPAGVLDVFVDGKASNDTINGHKVGFWLVSWAGNYEPPRVPPSEFQKFLGTVEANLRGAGFDPTTPDEGVLANLNFLNYRITHGIIRVERYIELQGLGEKYTGDQVRKRLRTIYSEHLRDPTSIYSCYADYTGGEFDGDPPLPGGVPGGPNFSY